MDDILDIIRDAFETRRIDGWAASWPFTDEPDKIVVTDPDGTDWTITVKQD